MTELRWSVLPTEVYGGPDFAEFCIDEGEYLSARRDRSACITCPLSELCQAGFEEQVRRVAAGENPSLTDGRRFAEADLAAERLLIGLSADATSFVLQKIPSLGKGSEVRHGE